MPFLTNIRRLLILIAILRPAVYANEPSKARFPPYTVVDCCYSQGMTVFPFDGAPFTIPLPFEPRASAFGPKGNALYAVKPRGADGQAGSGIVKIEFHPTRVNPVWHSLDLEISSFAVSMREDKLVLAARPLVSG